MKAMILKSAGQPLIHEEIAKPVAAAGQVLVRIHASAVNPLDLKIAAGKADHARMPLPAVLGIDMAGVVEAVGPGVTAFVPGDAVFGMTGGVGGVQGSLAEYAAVDADLLAHAPRSISLRHAAALPLAIITAWEGLVDRAHVQAGQSVLVQGGAGGVGRMAVQLALALGAQVSATGRAAQREAIEAMGARFIEQLDGEEFDIVYDTVGGAVLDASFRAVREYGGHVVSALGWGTHALAPLSFRAASYSGVFTLLPLLSGKRRAAHGAILREAARLVDAGQLSVHLHGERFTLAQANQAHAALGGGKVVVDIA
ncbi:NADPH:quinone reductase [Duganella sp. CF458]|uniref:zinc-dependent alcohol dehydrogenase family protein n=1 Tax=Duganella sp. CF458 TaxID=1884368 RepID=UPI0008E6AFF8|nr:zinc-dependent alcohol dehydrogenase family protein [Duganella sp. CF458]SFF63719.1 NADPH:quinone reductase [Duganella sp. CF458]